MARMPARLCRALIVAIGLTAAWTRWGSVHGGASPPSAFVGKPALQRARSHGDLIERQARTYQPIVRRDPFLNDKLQQYVSQQMKLVKRQESAGGAPQTTDKKREYLRRLGLNKKADELLDPEQRRPWHIEHMKPGDVYVGTLQHPDIAGGNRMDVSLTVTSETEGMLVSQRADIEKVVKIRQDYPIEWDKGEQRDQDMTAYVFHKFNKQWRNFDLPPPTEEETQHITLGGMREFIYQVTEVEGFPSKEEFAAKAADPYTGMTRAEFLAYLREESPDYLDKCFGAIYTGRRLLLYDEELKFDGDFMTKGDNLIFGYVAIKEKDGGSFSLELQMNR